MIFKDQYGALFVEGLSNGCYPLSNWWWIKNFLKALVKLKVISQADMDTHMAAVNKNATVAEQRDDKKELRKLFAKYQITPNGNKKLKDFLATA